MSHHFVELVVRARRLVTRAPARSPTGRRRVSARRRVAGGELTQFSFRLAFMIDLAYVGIGALGGAALGRGAVESTTTVPAAAASCPADSARSTSGPLPRLIR